MDGMDLADRHLLRHHRASALRHGGVGFETTRGDRLFISLLGSAFIHLAWLGLVGPSLWWALALSVVYAIAVFRYA
jgi:predicted small integral membrane protein